MVPGYRKKVLGVIVLIAISCGIMEFTKTISPNADSSNSAFGENVILDNANDTITSWYLNNSKELEIFVNDYHAWKEDPHYINSYVKINEPNNKVAEMRSTVIAILDSDMDIYDTLENSHIWSNRKEINGDNLDNDGNGFIDDYYGWNFSDKNNIIFNKKSHGIHGTYISSLLVGKDEANNYEGLIYDYSIEIMCLKVLSGLDERGNANSIVQGIKYAENMGAQICCLSLASPVDYTELKSVIKESNMLFVVASGNDGHELGDSYMVYPACYNYDNIITVADMRCDGKLSHSSNYGKDYVDIAAPGSDIVGMIPADKFIYLSGTSSATAIVAGAAAIVRNTSKDSLSPFEIKKALLDNAKVTDDLRNYVYTNGYLDITKSIRK